MSDPSAVDARGPSRAASDYDSDDYFDEFDEFDDMPLPSQTLRARKAAAGGGGGSGGSGAAASTSGGKKAKKRGAAATGAAAPAGPRAATVAAPPLPPSGEPAPSTPPAAAAATAPPKPSSPVVTSSTHAVYNRIVFDTDTFPGGPSEFAIGYTDRFLGVMEVPFAEFLRVKDDLVEGIPLHRVEHFRHTPTGVTFTRRNKYSEVEDWARAQRQAADAAAAATAVEPAAVPTPSLGLASPPALAVGTV